MGLAEIIAILNNRLTYLVAQRNEALTRGDINMVAFLDADTAKTAASLSTILGAG